MFLNYSAKALRTIMYARTEAGAHGAAAIEPEHILLGLLRADMDLINRFYSPSFSLVSFLALVEARATVREEIPLSLELPLSAESERVLRHAAEAADGLASRQIESGHILLGLLSEEDCAAARMLRECGMDVSLIRRSLPGGDAAA
jgi:ATP-dependent Clp protease ATP-binding subunit ClpC